MEKKVHAAVVETTKGAEGALMRRVKEAQWLTVEAFWWSSDYQRDLDEVAMDSYLMGFKDCCTKVLQKYPDVELGGISLIDTPSMSQVLDSPPTDDAEASTALIGEDDADRD